MTELLYETIISSLNTTTWFTSTDYQSAICSTENLTKAVKRLPEIPHKSICKATKDV